MRIKLKKIIEVQELNQFIEKIYGRPYNFQQQDGCKDRGIYKFIVPSSEDDFKNETVPEKVNHETRGVKFSAWLKRDPNAKISEEKDGELDYVRRLWWERNFYPDFQTLANDLHAKGLLEAGKYTIEIDW